MVRAPLDDDIPLPQERLALVQNQRHFTRDNDAVVDRLGAVHQGMRGVGLDGRGVCIADLGESCVHPLGAPIDEVLGVRRNVDETDPRPVHRRRQFDRAGRWIGFVSNRRWTALRAPHFMEDCSRQCGEFDHGRQRAVRSDYRLAVSAMPSDDPTDR